MLTAKNRFDKTSAYKPLKIFQGVSGELEKRRGGGGGGASNRYKKFGAKLLN